jgi:hypothetical protein
VYVTHVLTTTVEQISLEKPMYCINVAFAQTALLAQQTQTPATERE